MVRGTPGRGSSPSPPSRRAKNRDRHFQTVVRLTPSRAATAILGPPSAQASTIRARSASPWAVFRRFAQFSSVRRSASDNTSGSNLVSPMPPADRGPTATSPPSRNLRRNATHVVTREHKTGTLGVLKRHASMAAAGLRKPRRGAAGRTWASDYGKTRPAMCRRGVSGGQHREAASFMSGPRAHTPAVPSPSAVEPGRGSARGRRDALPAGDIGPAGRMRQCGATHDANSPPTWPASSSAPAPAQRAATDEESSPRWTNP